MRTNYLLTPKKGRGYRIVMLQQFKEMPEKVKSMYLVVDQGTFEYLKSKIQILNGTTSKK
jgi:hypothetical protein